MRELKGPSSAGSGLLIVVSSVASGSRIGRISRSPGMPWVGFCKEWLLKSISLAAKLLSQEGRWTGCVSIVQCQYKMPRGQGRGLTLPCTVPCPAAHIPL